MLNGLAAARKNRSEQEPENHVTFDLAGLDMAACLDIEEVLWACRQSERFHLVGANTQFDLEGVHPQREATLIVYEEIRKLLCGHACTEAPPVRQ